MPWYNPFSWVGSSDGRSQSELQAEGDALDRRLAELNQQAAPRYGAEWFAQAEANRQGGYVDVEEEVTEAGREGLREGYDNVTGAIRETVNFPLKFLWDALPWWVWVGAVVGLFFYFGGGAVVRRKVSSL
jgi:hypothetical protein